MSMTLKAVCGFLGLIGYYIKSIWDYGKITSLLTKMLKRNALKWSSTSLEVSFQKLKEEMAQALVLALPYFDKPFIVKCDASELGIDAVLLQERPTAFFRHALHGKNLLLSTYEKEILALIHVVQGWRPYLLGRQFVV